MQGLKTFIFGLATVVLGFIEQNATAGGFIPDDYQGAALSAVGFGTMALRFFTTTPIFEKSK